MCVIKLLEKPNKLPKQSNYVSLSLSSSLPTKENSVDKQKAFKKIKN